MIAAWKATVQFGHLGLSVLQMTGSTVVCLYFNKHWRSL